MRLPLELHKAGNHGSMSAGETRNLSSGGVLFSLDGILTPGDPIEYTITLGGSGSEAVRIRCLGKVVRTADDSEFAATLERYEFVRVPEY